MNGELMMQVLNYTNLGVLNTMVCLEFDENDFKQINF